MVRGHTSAISYTIFLHSVICIPDLDVVVVRKFLLELNSLGGCPSVLLRGWMRRFAGFEKEAARSRTLPVTRRNGLRGAGNDYLSGLNNSRRLKRIDHFTGYDRSSTNQLAVGSQSANISTNVTARSGGFLCSRDY